MNADTTKTTHPSPRPSEFFSTLSKADVSMESMAPALLSGLPSTLPIGIFDSGVGGLTVLAALRGRLPDERLIYLGDTARLPYGTKGEETVIRYALQAAEKLVERHIKLLVVACNTATAAALPALQRAYAPLPVVGVVEPGAQAACAASKTGHILVLGTESTIRSNAYSKAIRALRPEAEVTGVACSLFVPLAEEGWVDGPIVEGAAARYLTPVLVPIWTPASVPVSDSASSVSGAGQNGFAAERRQAASVPEAGLTPAGGDSAAANHAGPDCVVLGCTHFPLLAPAVVKVVTALAGPKVTFVDSAATTAQAVEDELRRLDLLRPAVANTTANAAGKIDQNTAGRGNGKLHFLCTDAPERFARVGGLFLGEPINRENLELVVL